MWQHEEIKYKENGTTLFLLNWVKGFKTTATQQLVILFPNTKEVVGHLREACALDIVVNQSPSSYTLGMFSLLPTRKRNWTS